MAALEPLVRVVSTATALPIDSIDTDVITPMHRVMDGSFTEFAFEPLRFDAQGKPKANPLDHPDHREDQILVAGANFGCGSSRETAVWAIRGMGYRVVIAESFGDIFFTNCFRNAILPVVLPSSEVAELTADAEALEQFVVDVDAASIQVAGRTIRFDLPPLRRTALIEGLDDLDVARRLESEIARFEADDRRRRPWAQLAATEFTPPGPRAP